MGQGYGDLKHSFSRKIPQNETSSNEEHQFDGIAKTETTVLDLTMDVVEDVETDSFSSASLSSISTSTISCSSNKLRSDSTESAMTAEMESRFRKDHCPSVNSCDNFRPEASICRAFVGLENFEILNLLGNGSHGKVYLVRRRNNPCSELYAMKEFKKNAVLSKRQCKQTKRELEIHVRLAEDRENNCPYITPLYFAFHTKTRLYMVFKFCSGGELYHQEP